MQYVDDAATLASLAVVCAQNSNKVLSLFYGFSVGREDEEDRYCSSQLPMIDIIDASPLSKGSVRHRDHLTKGSRATANVR